VRSNGSAPGVIAHAGLAVGVATGKVGLAGFCGLVGDATSNGVGLAAAGAVAVCCGVPDVGEGVEPLSDSLQPALQSRPANTLDTSHLLFLMYASYAQRLARLKKPGNALRRARRLVPSPW
jgi:hypothetical protein